MYINIYMYIYIYIEIDVFYSLTKRNVIDILFYFKGGWQDIGPIGPPRPLCTKHTKNTQIYFPNSNTFESFRKKIKLWNLEHFKP